MRKFDITNKNISIKHNVTINVIEPTSGKIVASHTGHNAATNSLLYGVGRYLLGDSVLNQGYDMLRDYVPQYISLGTMGLYNQEEDETGLPTGIGMSEDWSPEQNYNGYMHQTPGYGADGYDAAENNDRKWFGLGLPFDQRPGLDADPENTSTINCELISESFPRTRISYRKFIPEYESERPETIDIIYSTMISIGAMKQFRESGKDYLFITEAGLWSKSSWSNSSENGLLAGYRIIPPDEKNWDMVNAAHVADDNLMTVGERNREILRKNILRVNKNQVVQVIWKIQIGSVRQFPQPEVFAAVFLKGETAESSILHADIVGQPPAEIVTFEGIPFILPDQHTLKSQPELYEFDGWKLYGGDGTVYQPGYQYDEDNNAGMPDHNIAFIAQWRRLPVAIYTINVLLQNILNNNYTLDQAITDVGMIGSTTNVTESDIPNSHREGFTLQPIEQRPILSDGSTVVRAEFNRNKYNFSYDFNGGFIISETTFVVTFNAQGGSPTPNAQTLHYNDHVSEPTPQPTKSGHSLNGWYRNASGTGVPWNFAVDKVTSNVTLFAKWTPESITYTVKHYLQNINDDSYPVTPEATETLAGVYGEYTQAEAKTYPGFYVKPFQQVLINNSGIVIKIYYDRNRYNYAFNFNGGTIQ